MLSLLTLLFGLSFASLTFAAPTAEKVVRAYAQNVYESYSSATTDAKQLRDAVESFLRTPSLQSLELARAAWRSARKSYMPTEIFRFYAGPIDGEEGPEGLINAWPMDEAYVDYVDGAPDAGIINNPAAFPKITKELLLSLNEKEGEKSIATGYHVIEFLLWGQDRSLDRAGNRPFSDFVVGVGKNADRRRQYLSVAAELLVEHISQVRDAWNPETGAFRKVFSDSARTQYALKDILTGAFYLSGDELAHERMFVAYESRLQEDEHSCFSDNTQPEFVQNMKGFDLLFAGENGLLAYLATAGDAAQVQVLEARLVEAKAAVEAIPAPFDRALQSEAGLEKILAAVTALEDLSTQIQESAKAVGLDVK